MSEKKKQETTASKAQEDLEARQSDEYVPDSVVGNSVTVNPNPFGEEEYAGTDPIYQNYANETEKPYASEDGPEKAAEEEVKKLYSLDDVDEDDVVEDYGQGGKARRAGNPNSQPDRYLVPGQEGYDRQKAEEQHGPPLRVKAKDDGDKSEPVKEAEFPAESGSAPVHPKAPTQQGDASADTKK